MAQPRKYTAARLASAPAPRINPAGAHRALYPFTRFSKYFVEVARYGSLRKAAEVLHVSASAIDRQLLMAEEEFGVALFERLPSGLRLTAAGELLLGDLRRWQKDFARTIERFGELQGLRQGHVTLAVIEALGGWPLAGCVASVTEDHPGLTFSLRVEENWHIADLVAASEVDCGLMLTDRPINGLTIEPLVRNPLGVVLPMGHALADQAQLSFGQTVGLRHVIPAEPLTIHPQVTALYEHHRIPLQRVIACNDIRLIRTLIGEGAGVAVLSYLDVAEDVRQERLTFVPLNPRQVRPMNLSLCIAPQRQLSRATQMLMDRLRKTFAAVSI